MMPNTTCRTHTVSLYLEASSDIALSMIHTFDSLNHKAKRSVCKLCRLSSNKENSYYNISPLTTIVLLLMKSGDVSPNPGPPGRKRTYNPKHPCCHCGKGVTGRSRAISCDSCDQWTHNKCAGVLSNDAYDELCSSGGEFTPLCNQCTLHALPCADDSDHPAIITQGNDLLSEIVEDAADQATTERPLDFECLHSKGLNFIHLNTRSLLPKLDELRILAANTKVAVIGITESWLDASVTDSEINITDYSILRRDRNRGNYRPISILNTLSKLFERIVYQQLNAYLQTHQLLYEHQSGFRSYYSTETCLIYLTDFIKQEQDKGNYVGMVLLDLQKAFDTVNHKIMLQKLEAIGLHESAIAWFNSYLYGRQQSVEISEAISNPMTVTCGVPQGSILGPLLFLIYILMIFTQLFAANYFCMLMIQPF
ncbi:hypothetical protein NP493_1083g00012 [Ridgeia piscesae]|uniref:Reverse transcriptase domain-containing protein n=1 Tax=Ridgeia piscesae TaxID=27915 RepID=A0AAD9KHA3_RIDPI|nr:hypothetical protein NP493_1083g00012 [Ridgeia piscesae]